MLNIAEWKLCQRIAICHRSQHRCEHPTRMGEMCWLVLYVEILISCIDPSRVFMCAMRALLAYRFYDSNYKRAHCDDTTDLLSSLIACSYATTATSNGPRRVLCVTWRRSSNACGNVHKWWHVRAIVCDTFVFRRLGVIWKSPAGTPSFVAVGGVVRLACIAHIISLRISVYPPEA